MDSISSFAENLILGEIENIQEGKVLPPSIDRQQPSPAPNVTDIRNIEVPDSLMREILGEEAVPFRGFDLETKEKEEPQLVEPVSEEPDSFIINEEKIDELIYLLKEVKSLLSEMTMATTTSGQIGVNLAGPQKLSLSLIHI